MASEAFDALSVGSSSSSDIKSCDDYSDTFEWFLEYTKNNNLKLCSGTNHYAALIKIGGGHCEIFHYRT